MKCTPPISCVRVGEPTCVYISQNAGRELALSTISLCLQCHTTYLTLKTPLAQGRRKQAIILLGKTPFTVLTCNPASGLFTSLLNQRFFQYAQSKMFKRRSCSREVAVVLYLFQCYTTSCFQLPALIQEQE